MTPEEQRLDNLEERVAALEVLVHDMDVAGGKLNGVVTQLIQLIGPHLVAAQKGKSK